MNIETIFYTQIASILGLIFTVFALYRLLVSQKDSVIELLRQRISNLENKITDLETQSPDVLVESLASRVEIAKIEISRLREDGEDYKGQIAEKEGKLHLLNGKLNKLNVLLKDSELLCPECQAPLLRRDFHTIYGYMNGREVDAEIEYVEYECGFARREDQEVPIAPCGATKGKP